MPPLMLQEIANEKDFWYVGIYNETIKDFWPKLPVIESNSDDLESHIKASPDNELLAEIHSKNGEHIIAKLERNGYKFKNKIIQ